MSTKEEEEITDKIMDIVDTRDYKIPGPVLNIKINRGIKAMLRNLFGSDTVQEEYQPYDKLNAFSTDQIEKIVPRPDWFQAHDNLEVFLDQQIEENPSSKIVFVSKPNSGTMAIVRDYIETHDYKIQEDPGYDTIMNYQVGDPIPIDLDQNIALLNLENWFLQYFSGLEFIEQVMQILEDHEHSVIIVCNSWTWKFITSVLKIPTSHYTIKMFQSLDYKQLKEWLLNLSVSSKKRLLLYRMADSGKLVSQKQVSVVQNLEELMSGDDQPPEDLQDGMLEVDSTYMKKLAAYSMGLPHTCWHIWRHSLRKHRDEGMEIDEEDKFNLYTIWVLPWDEISLPSLSKAMTSDEKMLLYAIVLHNGLPFDIIQRILDIEPYHLKDHFERLNKAGIIYESNEEYYVSSNVYPKIRRVLGASGFLLDTVEVA